MRAQFLLFCTCREAWKSWLQRDEPDRPACGLEVIKAPARLSDALAHVIATHCHNYSLEEKVQFSFKL